jgi:hypothetical protein
MGKKKIRFQKSHNKSFVKERNEQEQRKKREVMSIIMKYSSSYSHSIDNLQNVE